MSRRTWVAIGVVAVLLVGTAAALGVSRKVRSCGDAVTSLSAKRSSSPFLDAAGRKQQPDADRDRAVASLGTAPPPFGPVVGAVGYDYEQWAQISAYDQGIGVRTRDNPDFTMLDDHTLEPLWSVQVDTKRSTYDASSDTYLVATLPRKGAPDVVALDASTGKRRWCAGLGGPHVGATAPFATQMLDDGGVVVLGPGTAGKERIVRLDRHGKNLWTRELDADQGDFLGLVGEGLLVAGGRPLYELSEPRDFQGHSSRLVALDLTTGHTVWRTEAVANAGSHVVGVDDGLSVVLLRGANGSEALTAFDEQGAQVWSVHPPLTAPLDVTLRSGRVLVRSDDTWAAYDAGTGRALWRRRMPMTQQQFLPYGFQLDDVPLLDATHALIGMTMGLSVLDLRNGGFTATAPLPTDGINTTFWPYQVAVSPHLIAVATNTSAVVMSRR